MTVIATDGVVNIAGKAVGAVKGAGVAGEVADVTKTAGQLGREGMAAARIEQNTTKIPSLTGTAAYRVLNGLANTTLSEVENVAKQSLTSQIKDFAQYSQQNGLNFELHVRESTQLSKPLQQQVLNGNIKLKFLPGQ
ncbi:putative toxin [Chitinophagaceae bacterium LWZ2-11]